MSHMFFNHSNSIAKNASMHGTFVPASHNLNITPNAVHKGMPVEADDEGTIVAARFPDGKAMRNNFHYIVHQTPTENLLIDRNQIVHPID